MLSRNIMTGRSSRATQVRTHSQDRWISVGTYCTCGDSSPASLSKRQGTIMEALSTTASLSLHLACTFSQHTQLFEHEQPHQARHIMYRAPVEMLNVVAGLVPLCGKR